MKPVSMPAGLALLNGEQLRDFGRSVAETVGPEIVAAVLAAHQEPLLDRSRAAEFLGCSLPTLDKLRAEGLPELRVGDAPRFEREAVLGWLRARGQQQKER